MGYGKYNLSKKDEIKWGLANKEVSKSKYTQYMENICGHKKVTINVCGLQFYIQKPYLEATADGISMCECHIGE